MIRIQGASLHGRSHIERARNNQDAFAYASVRGLTIGVVADGTSSGVATEVGSRLACRWIVARALQTHAANGGVGSLVDHDAFAASVSEELPKWLHAIADVLVTPNDERIDIVMDLLSFTLLIVLADDRALSMYGCGDGIVRVDGHALPMPEKTEPGGQNLVTRGLPATTVGAAATAASLVRLACVDHGAWKTVLIATDGALELKAVEDPKEPLFTSLERTSEAVLKRAPVFEAALRASATTHGSPYDDATIVMLGSRA